jgi:hypothetical protein
MKHRRIVRSRKIIKRNEFGNSAFINKLIAAIQGITGYSYAKIKKFLGSVSGSFRRPKRNHQRSSRRSSEAYDVTNDNALFDFGNEDGFYDEYPDDYIVQMISPKKYKYSPKYNYGRKRSLRTRRA